jgi:hypothetical protein
MLFRGQDTSEAAPQTSEDSSPMQSGLRQICVSEVAFERLVKILEPKDLEYLMVSCRSVSFRISNQSAVNLVPQTFSSYETNCHLLRRYLAG